MSSMNDMNHHERPREPGDRDEVFLSDWVTAGRDDIPSETSWQHARSRLMTNLGNPISRRTPMLRVVHYASRHRWLTAAALACLFFSILIGLNPWSQSMALSTVIKSIRDIHAYSTKTTYFVENGEVFTIRSQYLAPGKWRLENIGGSVHIIDLEKGQMLNLFPSGKMAMVVPLGKQEVTEQFDHLWLEKLRDFEGKADETLPSRMVNGQVCTGFRINNSSHDLTVWADQETGLPVLMEIEMTGPTNTRLEIEVEYPEDLDPGLFSMDIPPGYRIMGEEPEDEPNNPK